MMSFITCQLRSLVCIVLLGWSGFAVAGMPPWPEQPFSYYSEKKPLLDVLRDFAANFSLSLEVGGDYDDVVDGRFNTASPTEFINRLGGVFGFQWFAHAGTLYISRNRELATRVLPLSLPEPGALREALSTLDILDDRFGWGELPEQGVVMVSGPPAYVDLVEQTMATLPSVSASQNVRVFRLQHASVVDRTIDYRDRELRVPGVASILQDLIASSGGIHEVLANPDMTMTRAAGRSRPVVIEDEEGAGGGVQNVTRTDGRVRINASIQADPRINALIVMDRPERMPLYERLVAMMDVQNALIEIEAMIVDISRSSLEELGISWSAVSRDGSRGIAYGDPANTSADNSFSFIGAERGASIDPTTLLVSGTTDFFLSRLRALERTGDADIQSSPSILTEENAEALLDLSETFYVRVEGERVASLTPITAGTTLKVTPRVVRKMGEYRVWLAVDIEDGGITTREVDGIPGVRSSTLSTQAVVGQDESLLIGGYNTEQRVASKDQVPMLGDIPVVGLFFSSRSTDVQQRERLFLIRPKIVELPNGESLPEPVRAPVREAYFRPRPSEG